MLHARIIYEINCYVSKPTAWHAFLFKIGARKSVPCRVFSSIWLTFRPYDEEERYYDVATKIVGPLPDEQAESVARSLEGVLRSAGIQVSRETTADD